MTSYRQPSGWAVGWTAFAGIMMILNGIWWIIAGIAAIANENLFVLTEDYIFKFDITTWGWIHLLVGALVVFAGFGLFTGKVWARTVGVIVAVLAGIIAFSWIPYYPIWGILFVAVSVAIIWSLTAHGEDITM